MKILVINGPNLNLLGIREPEIYGREDYRALCREIRKTAKELSLSVRIMQSNSESRIVTEIGRAYRRYDGILLNAAAFTHTSIAIADALRAVGIPVAEVHLTDIDKREDFRKVSYIRDVAFTCRMGEGFDSYRAALRDLAAFGEAKECR